VIDNDRRTGRPAAVDTARRALLTVALWWVAVVIGFVVFAAFVMSRPAPPGCSGLSCLGEQDAYVLDGVLVGVPTLLIGLPLDCVVVAVVVVLAKGRVRSGAVLGTTVALASFAVSAAVLPLAAPI
jgi:hypothetical protein